MAAQKQHKAELIAIYRLDFYKRQKNWKLSSDVRKDKEVKSSRPSLPSNSKILNETYSIETNIDNEDSVLNDAFLKDESDNDAPESPPVHTSLHRELLAPINACQECQQTNAKPQNPWSDYLDDWVGGSELDKCSGDGLNEFEGFDGWVEGMVWTNSAIPQPEWTGDVGAPLVMPAPELGWAGPQLCRQLDSLQPLTPWPDDQLWVTDVWAEEDFLSQSLESLDEFMIGAHSAPHSSEMELCVADYDGAGGGEAAAGQGSLSRLSGTALSAAVLRHTGSLRRLLREARRRKHRSTLSLDLCAPDHFGLAPRDFFSTDYSYEAFPTRDVPITPVPPIYLNRDGLTPMSPSNLCKDAFSTLPPTRQCRDSFTPKSPTNLYRDGSTPIPTANQYKDGFIPLSPPSRCEANFAQPPPANKCKDNFTSQLLTNQRRDAFTPLSPANLYRDGFLAGSYRNKVPLGFVGRGRGRLPDRGVEA